MTATGSSLDLLHILLLYFDPSSYSTNVSNYVLISKLYNSEGGRKGRREGGREGGNGREYTFICMIMGVYVCCMYVHASITSIACIV